MRLEPTRTRMRFALVALQVGDGFLETVVQAAVVAGSLVFVLGLVALGAFAYRSLRGDGIRWPDETEEPDPEEGARPGDADDEWDYY